MNLGRLITEEESAYLDHREKDADGSKSGLGWCDARDLLREIQGVDGHVEQGESTVPPLRSLGFDCHGRNVR